MNYLQPKTVKRVGFGNDDLVKGINILADAVGSTLGASGRTVVIEDDMGNPHVTKDGVTVAKSILLEDPVQNLGVSMMKQAASQTANKAGDGTTTSTVLAQAIIKEYLEQEGVKHSFRDIKAGIEAASENCLKFLKKKAQKVNNKKLKEVSIISTNNDKSLGKVIAEAFENAGDNGVVTMEPSPTSETFITKVDGTRLASRTKNAHFLTDRDKEIAELEKPLIFIAATEIENIRKIQIILEYAIKNNRSILLIAPLKEQPTMALAMNNVKGNIKVNVVDPPSFGLKRKDLLDDLALLVGAKVFDDSLGDAVDAVTPDMLGSVDKAITDNDGTILIVDEKINADERISELKKSLEEAEHPALVRHFESRLALLCGGVSIINVGADTEVELSEKKDRVDDAIHAVKAAKKEGILPGGGSALSFWAANNEYTGNAGELTGHNILVKALWAPMKKIASNAGIKFKEGALPWGMGIDVTDAKIKDMRKAGIIDPAMVTKEALTNAVSVAIAILSTDCVISNVRD